jgi:hypothetical protein
MGQFFDRMVRAAKLDVSVYEEVEADKGSLGQALGVVALSSLAAGIGTMKEASLMGLLIGTGAALAGWYVWAFLGFLPAVSGIVFLGASLWMLVTMVVAVRQALDYQSTARAIGVCLIGWLIQALILIMVIVLAGGAPDQQP